MKLVINVMATLALSTATLIAGGALPVNATVATPAVAAPAVAVSPSHGLVGGRNVHVSGTGLTPAASVTVIECDVYIGDPEQDCFPLTTTTASSSGAVSLGVTVTAVPLRNEPFGDPTPIYCRADGCHIFLAWTDQNGETQVASSTALEFAGAPARIHTRPASDLTDGQVIHVNGSAYGAFGHKVLVLEEACYNIIQGSGCYGALPAVSTFVEPDGTFAVTYHASRFLADGTDCSDPDILGSCEMSVVVLNHGQPDDSFGVSRIGQPAAQITFAATPG
jgi:hypothetical protein